MKASFGKSFSGIDISTLQLPHLSEHCITASCGTGADTANVIDSALESRNAKISSQFIFSGHGIKPEYLCRNASENGISINLCGDYYLQNEISAIQAFAFSGIETESLTINGQKIGFIYEDENARYCRLCGVTTKDLRASRPEQAISVFNTFDKALSSHGFRFTDTVRTWFYLDHILEWYDEFNAVRTAFFESTGIFDALVPASTGIGIGNSSGSALTADLFAVQPKSEKLKIRPLPSPMQGTAMSYKSSFSRALEMQYPTHRCIMISGTASIDKAGKTVHLNDTASQIDLTMQVVGALLDSQELNWSNVSRAIAYFRNRNDVPVFERYCIEKQIPHLPAAIVYADICRDDLLFEIEADAIGIL